MPAKYFSIIRNYVLSVSLQRKYTFYHQNTFLDAFGTNSRNIIGRNPSMVIPLLANQDLTPMPCELGEFRLVHPHSRVLRHSTAYTVAIYSCEEASASPRFIVLNVPAACYPNENDNILTTGNTVQYILAIPSPMVVPLAALPLNVS